MSTLVLYTNPQSRGRIAHWLMEEIGQPYDTVWLDFGPPMRTQAYLDINPMGKVPALQHGEAIVTETAAICAYMADTFPAAGLIPPPGSPERAAFYRWLFFTAGPIEMATTAKSFGWEVPEGKSGMVGFGKYSRALDTLEKALQPGPFICGDQFTAVDVYVCSALAWGMMMGSVEKRPAFAEYVARLQERPAAMRSNQINNDKMKGA
ncbi:MAG: glutathione S-transferase family protein [Burkholderiales bacterium]|nr:glutathione S-transferase family protein [Burkholderiales bacterium]